MITVYAICDPDDADLVRYVGVTTTAPRIRFDHHLTTAAKQDTPLARWIVWLRERGRKPLLRILRTADFSRGFAATLESEEIAHWRGVIGGLLNCQQNGEHYQSTRRRRNAERHEWDAVCLKAVMLCIEHGLIPPPRPTDAWAARLLPADQRPRKNRTGRSEAERVLRHITREKQQ